jgi:hypothetical protein
MGTLVVLEDRFNDENIIAIREVLPDKVVYLTTLKGLHAGYFEDFKDFMSYEFPEVVVEVRKLDFAVYDVMYGFFKELTQPVQVHLNSSNALMSILAKGLCDQFDIEGLYVDILQNALFIIRKDGTKVMKSTLKSLNVENYIDLAGGEIIKTSTENHNNETYTLIVDYISQHFFEWRKLKGVLTNITYSLHPGDRPEKVYMEESRMSKAEYKTYQTFREFLINKHIAQFKRSKNGHVELTFASPEIKNYIFITGSWLESLTYRFVKEIGGVEDVKSGVSFSWEGDKNIVRNELDVLATYHSRLFVFSCKDTSKYHEGSLNELMVYAQKIGGYHVRKILVVTEMPQKISIVERAQEMGIILILFDGSLTGFKRQLERVFLNADILS